MYYQYPYTGYRNIPNGDERFFGFPFVAGLAGGLLGGLAVGGFGGRPGCCPPPYPYPVPFYGGGFPGGGFPGGGFPGAGYGGGAPVYNTYYGPGYGPVGPIPR
ncbi:hypothetical protein ACQJ0K_07560 [Priestia megaterium]|uniref:hypothetical protein n=1 Tax=Priestia megaterium TaxID=1404 RepID=UPI003CF03DF6